MRSFGSLVRPPSLVQAFVTTGALIGASVLCTIALVVAAAHAFDSSTSPLVAATEVRHAAMTAALLEGEARQVVVLGHAGRGTVPAELPRLEAEIRAVHSAVRARLEGLREGVRTLQTPQTSGADTLVPLWDRRNEAAWEAARVAALTPPGSPRSPLFAQRLSDLEEASRRFNDELQTVVASLDGAVRRSVSTLKYATLGTSALALALLAVGAAFSRREILAPLRRLAAAEASVARGRLDVRMDTHGVSEIRALALGFNEMVASLRARAAEVRAQQQLLTRRERALDRRNRELAAANAELDAFAYAASHDLRAPLRGIENMARFLSEDVGAALDGEARDKLERIRRAARRLHRARSTRSSTSRAPAASWGRARSSRSARPWAWRSSRSTPRSGTRARSSTSTPTCPRSRATGCAWPRCCRTSSRTRSSTRERPRSHAPRDGRGAQERRRGVGRVLGRGQRDRDPRGAAPAGLPALPPTPPRGRVRGRGRRPLDRAANGPGARRDVQVESAPGRGARFTVRLPAQVATAAPISSRKEAA